ncbi:serine/threonine-protein kinase [Bythopirellula goksoeyrii]|uniref:Serine/threonine-protein kinase PknB n=1 Tax=Bythopirellula goksoeyrii TaxID=1400387 RepID=A0A5B9QG64_9BACT|nr:serine/threonine-protein kinase [Bythopirellula goksoeyrii]QEG38018.1 Serine/threonine-protein kinase PknB [Bythopirellula goksoeyrii]
MSESSSHIYEQLPANQVAIVNQFCDQFEHAWRQGETPAIGDYLSTAPASVRKVLLHELVLIDATYRKQASVAFDVSDSYQQFHDLDQSWLAENIPTAVSIHPKDKSDLDPPMSTRYEIINEIGRGGMGIVYQARDRRLGRKVCLKSLHPETSRSPERLARFRREARVVSSLNHPNICTIYEFEEHDDRPYLVLEWIEGNTFRELERQGCDLRRLLGLMTQVARALDAAHAAGVVHRDIKPENLMVRGDGLAKVLDFGLARLVESEPSNVSLTDDQTAEGALLGTAKYMSPEQARGEPATAASDVFSLGIVLYELVTGRHPFPGAYLAGILNAIVETDPAPALTVNSVLDPQLVTLVSRMLEKIPEDRPTAADVVALLGSIDSLAEDQGICLSDSTTTTAQLIVGRESELQEIRLACTAAEGGRGGAVFVSGEAGIGKTTLLKGFANNVARRKGFIFLHGQCSQRLSTSDAYLPVLDALARCKDGPDGRFVEEMLKSKAPAWEALTASSTDALARLSTESGPLSQGRMKREFRTLLSALSQRRPVLLLLDDLHWSDASTVDLLSYVGQDLQDMRLLILGAYRTTESALENHPFERLRRDFVARGQGRDSTLPFLNCDEIVLFLERHFPAHRFPDSFAEFLHRRTEGSPLFLQGLVRYLQDRKVVTQEDDRWILTQDPLTLGHELPDSVASLIDTTLDQLKEEDRHLLQAASVQGSEFDSAVVADALEIDRAAAEEQLQRIEQVYGLIRTVEETEYSDGKLTLRHAFVHVLFQEALYAAITPARRAGWSLEIARVLEELHGRRAKGIALELAFLYEAARDFPSAIEWLLQAARQYVMIGANCEAAETCHRGLRLLEKLPPTSERDQTELELQFTSGFAETYVRGYGSSQSLLAYHRALELCERQPPTKEQFSVLHGIWVYHSARMDAENVATLEERIVQLANHLGLPCYHYAANTTIVLSLMHQGKLELAEKHLQLAQSVSEYSVDDDRHFIEQMCMPFGPAFHTARSWLRQLQGREEEALAETATAVAWEDELGVPQFQVSSWYATLHYLQRNAGQALYWARKSIEFARRADFDHYLDMASIIEAWAVEIGEVGDRLNRASLVEAVLKDMPDNRDERIRFGSPLQTCMLGEALASLGRHDEARAAFTDSLTFGRENNVRWWEAETLRQLGLLYEQAFDNLEQAEANVREGLVLAENQGAKLLVRRCLDDLKRLEAL